jgi:hypothetical protein
MADIFYNKTVTIWNCSASDDLMESETWYPTVLHNVRLRETQGANVAASGIDEADSAILHVLTTNLVKPYKAPIEWSKSEDKTESFTLCQDKDFFVVGDVSDVVPTSEFLRYMKANYDGVYQITHVDKYDLIPHFEIGGR